MLQGLFVGYAQRAGGSWNGDLLIIDWQELEEITNPAEIHIKRMKASEVNVVMWPSSSKEDEKFRFPVALGNIKQNKVRRPRTRKSDRSESSKDEARGNPEPEEDSLHENDRWTIQKNATILHHYKPRQYLSTPDPEDSQIPIEFLDVGRRTETNLEDEHEAVIDDIWYGSNPQYLTAPWTGRTILFLRHPKAPKNM